MFCLFVVVVIVIVVTSKHASDNYIKMCLVVKIIFKVSSSHYFKAWLASLKFKKQINFILFIFIVNFPP